MNKHRRWIVAGAAIILLLSLGACRGGISASNNIVTEERPVSGVHEVVMEGSGTLLIEHGERDTLTIEAADNILPLLTSDQQGDRLTLGVTSGTMLWRSGPITYRLTTTDLRALTVSGSGEVTADDIAGDTFAVTISGSADVDVKGEVGRQEVAISGSGKYLAENLASNVATVRVSGSGDATVRVSDVLSVNVSGSGNVNYVGSPTVRENITGSGDITRIAER
jgi:hypothetical protein